MSAAGEQLERRLHLHGLELTSSQMVQIVGYFEILRQWNARMNLTALDGDVALDRLIVEPALASRYIDDDAASLVDLGSGGGSPAIPLKIMRPDLRLTMVEVKVRKSVFLREVARQLKLSDTVVETAPFREALGSKLTGPIDVVSARAIRLESDDFAAIAEALRPRGQLLWFISEEQAIVDVPTLKLEQNFELTPSSRLASFRRSG